MELVLNLVWILLCVPAFWVFRRNLRNFSSAQRFLSLACALVILFPVISATDDLHAAPKAMEQSTSTKRSLKPGAQDKASAHNQLRTSAAHVIVAVSVCPGSEVCGKVQKALFSLRDFSPTLVQSRPPPQFSLP